MTTAAAAERDHRWHVLEQLDEWLRTPMLVLSLAWLVLVLLELLRGGSALIEVFGTAIWIVFIAEFCSDAGEVAGASQLGALQQEIAAIRRQLERSAA